MRMLVALCTGRRRSETGREVKRHHPVARCEVDVIGMEGRNVWDPFVYQ